MALDSKTPFDLEAKKKPLKIWLSEATKVTARLKTLMKKQKSLVLYNEAAQSYLDFLCGKMCKDWSQQHLSFSIIFSISG